MSADKYRWTGWRKMECKSDCGDGGCICHLTVSPYVDWIETIAGEGATRNRTVELFKDVGRSEQARKVAALHGANESIEGVIAAVSPEGYKSPIAEEADNFTKFQQDVGFKKWVDTITLDQLPELDADSIIVGVIDRGIPLGHRSSRDDTGKTRILAAWQQGGDRTKLAPGLQEYLPFGTEWLGTEIDDLLESNSFPSLKSGWLDEDAFNRATGTEDYANRQGDRGLGLSASHGAHVLDAAIGFHPGDEDKLRAKSKIVAVNLPSRAVVGASGRFLEYYVMIGIKRIVDLADKAWSEIPKEQCGGRKGFPIVINFSFAKQASPRDGFDLIGNFITALNKERSEKPPVIFVMPAGNENLERGNVGTALATGAEAEFDWRIPSEDQTANFVELWSSPLEDLDEGAVPIQIAVGLPNGPISGLEGGQNGYIMDCVKDKTGAEDLPIARVYCRVTSARTLGEEDQGEADTQESTCETDEITAEPSESRNPSKGTAVRVQYILCTRQTNLYESTVVAKDGPDIAAVRQSVVSPSGHWKIRLRNNHFREVLLRGNVQTDQSEEPQSQTAQASRFDREEYRRFDDTGRPIDSYDYPLDGSRPSNLDNSNILRRHGTLSAIGQTKFRKKKKDPGPCGEEKTKDPDLIAVIGGYRAMDGRPAIYSATGLGEVKSAARAAPTAAFVSDDTPMMFGTLAAGSRCGTSVAQRGTSFAAAMATRVVARLLLDHGHDPKFDVDLAFSPAATNSINKEHNFFGTTDIEKTGRGRVPRSDEDIRSRVPRF